MPDVPGPHPSEVRATTTPAFTPRLLAALAAGKAAGLLSRLLRRGGGTSLPGMVAGRVAPDVLSTVVRRSGTPSAIVAGSNGKTTTARLGAALLRGEGRTVAHNSAGSNLLQGVASVAVTGADLRGRLAADILLAETDEGALMAVTTELSPRALLVTNLFRDQLDRYGEIYAVADAIAAAADALPTTSVLVRNADDPMVATLAPDRLGPRLTFGLELPESTDRITRAADTIRCPRCGGALTYRAVYLSHMGDWACSSCGLARPRLDVAVTAYAAEGGGTRCIVRTPAGATELSVPLAGIHIAYDLAGALALTVALGVPTPNAAASLARVTPAFGRLEEVEADGRRIVLAFAKNPTSYNTTLRALRNGGGGGPRRLLAAVSNTLVDGEDFAWLWDVDFESVAGDLEHITVSGTRADELANRLKYAGVDPARIDTIPERRAALDHALGRLPAGEPLTVLAGYTPLIELREEMHRRGWVGRYWQA